MQTSNSICFELALGDSLLPTCWPEPTSYRVGDVSTSRTLASFRRSALSARGVEAPAEAVWDEWDDAPESNSYLLSKKDGLVGTIRGTLNFARSRWQSIPDYPYFEQELRSMFRTERAVEANRLLTAPDDRGNGTRRLLALMQNVTAMADEHRCRYILAAARAHHTRFYFEMGFVQVTEAREFPSWLFPLVLLALDWQKQRHYLLHHKLYRYLFSARNFAAFGAIA